MSIFYITYNLLSKIGEKRLKKTLENWLKRNNYLGWLNKKMQNNSVSKNYFTNYIQNYIPKQFITDNLINVNYFKN